MLEEAEIGVYISESYALDIDRLSMYQESMGFLSVELSVPPKYGVVCVFKTCTGCLKSFGPIFSFFMFFHEFHLFVAKFSGVSGKMLLAIDAYS